LRCTAAADFAATSAENVLSGSRFNQTAEPELIEDVAWGDQFLRLRLILERRSDQVGMTLDVSTMGETSASFLSLCRCLAASMNGELPRVSGTGGGTTIELQLPGWGQLISSR
jgi:hypothetical protein